MFERFLLFDRDTDNPVANLIDLNILSHDQDASYSSESWIRQFYVPYNLADASSSSSPSLSPSPSSSLTTDHMIESIYSAFISTNIEFLQRSNPREKSGTTATTVTLLESKAQGNDLNVPKYKYLLVAHVGDSRAVLCCNGNFEAVPLTIDHTLNIESERFRVLNKGGYFNLSKGGIARVNDQLAVTRSLGTRTLRRVLSAIPDIQLIDLDSLTYQIEKDYTDKKSMEDEEFRTDEIDGSSCAKYFAIMHEGSNQHDSGGGVYPSHHHVKKFVIAGSDGLWDVFTNQDAVEFVCEYLMAEMLEYENNRKADHHDDNDASYEETILSYYHDRFHKAAKALSIEAFVRGSLDNIGACIIDIL